MNTSFIPYGKQDINQADIDAVVEVLKSDFLTQGPKVPAFEQAIKDYCDVEYALAVNSATSALHIACLSLGLGEGDWLWTTPITFVASANCGLYCGARIDFVDIDPKTYNISVEKLAEKLAIAKQENRLPKVVVPVHLTGQVCEMDKIRELSKQYGFYVIEDASHAIGGKYKGKPVGSCEYSDITVFSFHPVKIITTAEGGLCTTNNSKLAEKMELYRSHGITRNPELMTKEPDGSWYYQQIDIGYNYRMTELQAALGVSQMVRLDEFIAVRHALAKRYDELLTSLPVTIPWQHPDSYSGLHLYVIRLKLNEIQKTHKQVFDELRSKNIGVNLHYIPVYSQPYYQQFGFKVEDFSEAEQYYQEAISLPMFSSLTFEQQDVVIATLREVLCV
ncbi:UDP-4-amino-4,6-dideoxy-N-acetyl-beta-L-altrosamine transaminase [Pelistega sp. MC2]|uniref:UDP-4-amino-4, 6-dideoxy-N-acetyl-beta-L-altrosamine transaminase n=1 Tax=Pelistega sp. MC2 TaxID=1720297 RepID=UPI0008D9D45F|nr:UDP-4-amino-4,6-dideoxy-N-acetyl-beta-L-altrosamine transaminase [Pelistega sp. MC2]